MQDRREGSIPLHEFGNQDPEARRGPFQPHAGNPKCAAGHILVVSKPQGNKFFPANNSRRAPRAEMTEIWISVVPIKILQFLSFIGKCTNVKLNQKWSWFSARRRVPEPCAESGRRSRNGRGGVPFHFLDPGIPDGRLRGKSIMCLLLSNRWYVQK